MKFLKLLRVKFIIKVFAYFSKISIFFMNLYIKSQVKKS